MRLLIIDMSMQVARFEAPTVLGGRSNVQVF
jgi:hypothetical protein